MDQNKVTIVLAIWGAILSTISISWNIINARRDRGEIRFSYILRRKMNKPDGPEGLGLHITNIGRRSIRIKGIGGKVKHKKYIPFHWSVLPRELKEGEELFNYDVTWLDIRDMIGSGIKNIYVLDTNHKQWYMKKKDFNKMAKISQKN